MKFILFVLLLSLGFATGATSATLDFTGISGNQGGTLTLSNATLSGDWGFVYVGAGAGGEVDGFCFTNLLVTNCQGNGQILFSSPVDNLTFDLDVGDPGDNLTVSAYLEGGLLGALTFTTGGVADFSGFGAIDLLVFDDSSTGQGFAFSTFAFDDVTAPVAPPPPVPLPAGLVLMLTGIAGLALIRGRGKVFVRRT